MTISRLDERALYRIRVDNGRLEGAVPERLGGMKLVVVEAEGSPSLADLTGWVADQAALMGILDQLYSRGATLVSVERLEPDHDHEALSPLAADDPNRNKNTL